MKKQILLLPLSVTVGLILALGFVLGLDPSGTIMAASSAPEASTLATIRAEDPVEVSGSALASLAGVPIAELAVYAFDGSTWAPIPFQIDEVDASGAYTSTEDRLVDANDVLVFMARDLGVGAPVSEWPADAQARTHYRQALRAVDPLSDASGIVYVYRSTTLARSATSYVAWDQNAQSLTTPVFSTGFDPANFIGLANLSLHGGPDVLDRQKTRIAVKVFGLTLNYDEEQISSNFGIPATISFPVQGPVRVIRGGGTLNVALYRERFSFQTNLDTSGFTTGSVDELRTSLDLNDPATTGLTQFFDSNGSAVPIDGTPDALTGADLFKWYQVSGDASGPGGMVVAFPNLGVGKGSAANYYADTLAAVSGDTGDQKSFADTGLTIIQPAGLASVTLAGMILPQSATANVGQSIYDRTVTPITVQVSAAPYLDPATLQEIFLPLLQR